MGKAYGVILKAEWKMALESIDRKVWEDTIQKLFNFFNKTFWQKKLLLLRKMRSLGQTCQTFWLVALLLVHQIWLAICQIKAKEELFWILKRFFDYLPGCDCQRPKCPVAVMLKLCEIIFWSISVHGGVFFGPKL